MKCFIIAQVVNDYSQVIGYKLYDADTGETMTVQAEQIKAVLTKQPDFIKNANLVNGVINGTNGKLDRYARININGNLVRGDKSPLVVINKIDNVGYTVVDFKGQKAKVSTEKAVEYAKENGIANGKVVTQDSIEFISSISGEYEQIKLAPSKAGANTRVNIPLRMGGDVKTVAKHTEEDIEVEMEYNDVFQAMSAEQRNVLKQYYTWYTVDEYKKMAKNVRLNLAPGKAEKLAQLRGVDKWEFAGINDSYLERNFNAHCELGHRLRYEYFAIPEGVMDDNYKVRKKDHVAYMRARRDAVQDLRDAGAIVFGETCAGDFFNISPEDMKKLVKTRKTMSDEIELMSNILTNHLEESYNSKCSLLYQVINRLGSTENVIKAFGDNVGYTLLAFMKAKMPFPMSLVIIAADQARKDRERFYTTLFPEYSTLIIDMLNAYRDCEHNPRPLAAGGYLLNFITDYTLEGAYQYDPTTDEEGIRKDIGRYNKDTRNLRVAQISSLISSTSVNVGYLTKLETLVNFFKAFNYYNEMSKETLRIYNESLKTRHATLKALMLAIETIIEGNGVYKDLHFDLDEIDCDALVAVDSSIAFIFNEKDTFYSEKVYGNYCYHCRGVTFKKAIKAGSYLAIQCWKNIAEIANHVDSWSLEPAKLVDKALRPIIDKYDAKDREDETTDKYYSFLIAEAAKFGPFRDDIYAIAKVDPITNKELSRAMETKDRSYGVNCNDIDGKTTLLETRDIIEKTEINEQTYRYYLDLIKKNRENAKIQRDIKAQQQREEQEKLAKLAEQQRLKEEAAAKKEMEEEAKLDKLSSLLKSYKGDKNDYGIQTAQAILNQGIIYSRLSPKQKWRIDKTLKDLEEQADSNSNKSYNLDSIDIDGKEVVKKDEAKAEEKTEDKDSSASNEKAEASKSTSNQTTRSNESYIKEDNLKALNDEDAACAVRLLITKIRIKEERDNSIAFSTKVALTINNTGKMSVKQREYLMKGYNKLRERQEAEEKAGKV